MLELDEINIDILDLLQANGRMSYREIGVQVGLTAPAVTERIKKLEDSGIIKGYRASINYDVLAFPLLCVIRLNISRRDRSFDDDVRTIPEVIEAIRVTGSESHIIRARVRDTAHLEELLQRLGEHGDSITNIATSSPVPYRPMRLKAVHNAGR